MGRRPVPKHLSTLPGKPNHQAHGVLATVSSSYSPLWGWSPTCYSPVCHSRLNCSRLPCDLHVLGTPPAFILSQDQTLHRFTVSCSWPQGLALDFPITLQLLRSLQGSPVHLRGPGSSSPDRQRDQQILSQPLAREACDLPAGPSVRDRFSGARLRLSSTRVALYDNFRICQGFAARLQKTRQIAWSQYPAGPSCGGCQVLGTRREIILGPRGLVKLRSV